MKKPTTSEDMMLNQPSSPNHADSRELTVFKGKKPPISTLHNYASKQEKNAIEASPTKDTSDDELTKSNLVSLVFDELMNSYDFISVEEKLYVYIEELGYWKLITDSESQRELRRRVDRKWRGRVNKNNLQEIYEWLLLDAKHMEPTVFREGRHHLNFSDVAYNWKKDKITPDRKNFYFRYALHVPFKSSYDEKGAFHQFLEDVFGSDKESIAAFQSFISLALSDLRGQKYATVLYGPANSGKSVTMNLLRFLVGSENTGSVSFSQMNSEFHVAQLHGKRLNLSAEVSGVTLNRLDVFRALCGNDEVLVSNKLKDPFSFSNRSFLVFACNVLPKISDPLEAQSVMERFIIFPFKNVKPRSKWDPKLVEHLCEDYPSIIAFAIEGLRILEENKFKIQESPAMLRCKAQYAGSYDSFSIFAKKYLKASLESRVSSADIRQAYHQFCLVHDFEEVKDNIWGCILKRDFSCTSTTLTDKTDDRSRRIRGYNGIGLSKEASQLFEEVQTPAIEIADIFKK